MKTLSNPPSGRTPVTLISGYRGLADKLISSFLDAGHEVSVLVRRESALPSLRARFPKATFFVGDLSDLKSLDRWIEGTVERFGTIDCLINNAAITGPVGKLHEIPFEEFEEAIAIDLIAPSYLSHRVLRYFVEKKAGVILNLSGGGATAPRPHFAAYSAAKCAIVRLTETLSREYPELRFYAIAPGFLKTAMTEAVLSLDPKKVPGEYEDTKRRLDRGGEDPQRAADLALWLFKERPEGLSGKLISAVWDDYKALSNYDVKMGWWTLRRIDDLVIRNLRELSFSTEK